ncbi:MAG: hypothetical protein ACRDL6_06785 [Solirubrobacterales bacterium]
MRQAINENRTVQITLLGVLVLVVGFMLVTRMGGGGREQSPPATDPALSSDAAAAPGATASAPATGVVPPTAGAGAAPVPTGTATPSPAGPTGTVTPAALVPGPGLPANVKAAWNRGSPIALLIVRGGGIDDRLVRHSVEALSITGVAVFVARAKNVARYSRITQGVGVSRVPALVVVRPKSASGPVPQATVSYGFRSSQSVVQAVEDALYKGKDNLPYHPG